MNRTLYSRQFENKYNSRNFRYALVDHRTYGFAGTYSRPARCYGYWQGQRIQDHASPNDPYSLEIGMVREMLVGVSRRNEYCNNLPSEQV